MFFRRKRPPRYSFRDVPYRPPRERYPAGGTFRLVFKFYRAYIKPLRWKLALYITVGTLNACSVYLMAYYSKVVVDDVLRINVPISVVDTARRTKTRMAEIDSPKTPMRKTRSTVVHDAAASSSRQTSGSASEAYSQAHPPVRGPHAGGRLFFIFVLYIGTIFVLNRSMHRVMRVRHSIGHGFSINLRNDVHHKIVNMSSIYHKSTTPGRLMARILNDVNILRDQLVLNTETLVSQLIMFLLGFFILLKINWICAVTVVLAMVPYSLAMRTSRVKMRLFNREIRHSNACLWGLVSQKLDAMKAIFAYARERTEAINFFRLSAVMQRDSIRQQYVGASVGRSAQLLSAFTTYGIFIYSTTQVLDHRMSLGEMMFIHGTVSNLFTPVVHLTNLTVRMSNMLVVMQRIWHMLHSQDFIQEDSDAVALPIPLKKGIRIDHLTFSYGTDAPDVLHNIHLHIPPRSWVCVMGPSGSGKSTLAGLLARLYEPTSGTIFYDDIPLDKLLLSSLRRAIAVVPQEAQIFSGTIRENITYGFPDAEPNAIIAAAKAADCHGFILDLPVQYETIVGEKGTSLSGGQRQRISIARALLTDPRVLILDDCTSALDANTEAKIQETLERVMKDRTAVIVSQRVSMAVRCDRIVVLENGSITENGTHDELVNAGGFYSRLYAQQTG